MVGTQLTSRPARFFDVDKIRRLFGKTKRLLFASIELAKEAFGAAATVDEPRCQSDPSPKKICR